MRQAAVRLRGQRAAAVALQGTSGRCRPQQYQGKGSPWAFWGSRASDILVPLCKGWQVLPLVRKQRVGTCTIRPLHQGRLQLLLLMRQTWQQLRQPGPVARVRRSRRMRGTSPCPPNSWCWAQQTPRPLLPPTLWHPALAAAAALHTAPGSHSSRSQQRQQHALAAPRAWDPMQLAGWAAGTAVLAGVPQRRGLLQKLVLLAAAVLLQRVIHSCWQRQFSWRHWRGA
jgi:hypothetical protein